MGCWFGGPQHWKMVAGLVVHSIGRWLLAWLSTALEDGCWFACGPAFVVFWVPGLSQLDHTKTCFLIVF